MTIALFPGKFQPPHLGHITTLMKLYPKYDKIIIGITQDKPEVLSQEKRKELFDSFMDRIVHVQFLIEKVV